MPRLISMIPILNGVSMTARRAPGGNGANGSNCTSSGNTEPKVLAGKLPPQTSVGTMHAIEMAIAKGTNLP